ncbi:ATP-binding cassette domain-containing protein [Devosia algicola]|uniref:ATP-binding cassette domain-containing protein n=1 Tax=Devosia algicola TaxID=3026418 RepID=A0ABY7YJX5_9HYPH|nr:ATP-binding cassette domain-containing protein [Devosia algicola]WDR01586.1 ATP-binding cassette domain-containing protein [Devosia algicola]
MPDWWRAPGAIRLVQLLAAAFLSNMLLVVLPLFITAVYDRVVPYGAYETLSALCMGVIIVFAVDIGLRMARVNLLEAIGVSISLRLQRLFYRKLLRAPLAKNTKIASGVTALLHEVDGASLTMPALMVSLLADLPFVVIMLTLVAHLGGIVVMVPLMGVMLVAIVTAIGAGRARRAATVSHGLRVKVQDQAIESTAMLATIKVARAEGALIGRWAEATDAAAFAAHSARQTSAWSGQISLVATQMVIAFTVVVGAIQIGAGEMTLGNLAACVLLVGRIIAPANTIVSSTGSLLNMRVAIGGFFAVIDRAEESGGDEKLLAARPLKGQIDLHGVCFSYPGVAKRSVDGVNIAIAPGERIGIIGRNGCGKSSLLKLLPRLYEADSGNILFDGNDARQLAPQQLRRHISLMAQDTVLMHDSLRANICLGLDRVDPADFERAVTLSGVAEFARLHPEGYSANVGPRGEFLSGGERQAVGLARAILNDPRILLLDEPTAAMDSTAETGLIRNLPAFLVGRTVILATHRMQLLTLVDRLIWMDQGRIVADGPKAQILASLSKAA